MRRIRWRCRRGMLELDIVLARFVERYYAELDDAQRKIFEEMLDLSDAELWELITSNRAALQPQQQRILEYLQQV